MTPQSGVTEKPRSSEPSATAGNSPTTVVADADGVPRPLTRNERTRLTTPVPKPSAPVLKSPALRSPTMRSRAPRSATPPSTQLRTGSQRSDELSEVEDTTSGKTPSGPVSMAETTSIPQSLAASLPSATTLAATRPSPVNPIARQVPAPTAEKPVVDATPPTVTDSPIIDRTTSTVLGPPSQSPPEVENTVLFGPDTPQHDLASVPPTWGEFNEPDFVQPHRGRSIAISLFAVAVVLIVLGVLFLPSPLQGRFRQNDDRVESTGDTEPAPLITRPAGDLSAIPIDQDGETLEPLAGIGDRGGIADGESTDLSEIGSTGTPEIVGPGTEAGPSTTVEETTSTSVWVEPTVEPKEQWIATDAGVALPDVLFKIRFCESTNNYQSANGTSSARGAYQFLTKSWNWYGHAAEYGVASANLATPAQQDQAALKTFEQDGARPWAESRACWDSADIDPRYRTARPKTTPTTSAPPASSTSVAETTTTVASSTSEAPTTTTSTSASTTSASTTTASNGSSSTQQQSSSSTTGG